MTPIHEENVGFFAGLSYPFRGLGFVFFKHPELVRIWIFPILITASLLVTLLYSAWALHDEIVDVVWVAPSGEGTGNTLLRFAHGLLEVVAVLAGVVIAFVGTMLLSSVIAAPFNSRLSVEVERLSQGTEPPASDLAQEIVWVMRTIGLELFKLGVYLAVTIPLWLATLLVPAIGPVSTVLGFVVTAMHAAVDFTDHPQERRDRSVWSTYAFAVSRFRPMFGFGSAVVVLLFVPFLNLFLLPAVVAGGTLLFLRLEPDPPASSASDVSRSTG